MFDIAPTEFLLVVVVALMVIGPKDLPKAMRFVGKWMGKARGMARHFRAGMDTMMREAELEELEKQWKAQNAEIMRQFPNSSDVSAHPPAKSSPSTGGENSAASDGLKDGVQKDFAAATGKQPDVSDASPQSPASGDAPKASETHKTPPPSSELP